MNVNELIAELLSAFSLEVYGAARAYPQPFETPAAPSIVSPLLASVITSGFFTADLLLFDALEKRKAEFSANFETELRRYFTERAGKITLNPTENRCAFPPSPVRPLPSSRQKQIYCYDDLSPATAHYPFPAAEAILRFYPLSQILAEPVRLRTDQMILFGGLNRYTGRKLRSYFPQVEFIAIAPPEENLSEIFFASLQSSSENPQKNNFFYPPQTWGPLAPLAIRALRTGFCPAHFSESLRRSSPPEARKITAVAEYLLRSQPVSKSLLNLYEIKRGFFPCETVFSPPNPQIETPISAPDALSLPFTNMKNPASHFAVAT